MKNLAIMGIIASVLLVFVIIQTFQINAIKGSITGDTVKNSDSSGGESYDQMMARMHPDQAKQASSQPSQPTMVGGC